MHRVVLPFLLDSLNRLLKSSRNPPLFQIWCYLTLPFLSFKNLWQSYRSFQSWEGARCSLTLSTIYFGRSQNGPTSAMSVYRPDLSGNYGTPGNKIHKREIKRIQHIQLPLHLALHLPSASRLWALWYPPREILNRKSQQRTLTHMPLSEAAEQLGEECSKYSRMLRPHTFSVGDAIVDLSYVSTSLAGRIGWHASRNCYYSDHQIFAWGSKMNQAPLQNDG